MHPSIGSIEIARTFSGDKLFLVDTFSRISYLVERAHQSCISGCLTSGQEKMPHHAARIVKFVNQNLHSFKTIWSAALTLGRELPCKAMIAARGPIICLDLEYSSLAMEDVSCGTMNQHHSGLISEILERCGIFQ